MQVYSKRTVADAVLALVVQRLQEDDSDDTVYLGSYQNGREQGHTLTYRGRGRSVWVAWAEHRSSDSIVVYADKNNPMQGLSDEAYKNAASFGPDELIKAADHVVSVITGIVKKG